MLSLAFLIVALVLMILAAIGVPAGRYSLMAASLAFWIAADIIPRLP